MLAVEERTRVAIRNVLLAALFSEPSEAMLSYAANLADDYDSKISLTGAVSSRAICEVVKARQFDLLVLGVQVQDPRSPGLDAAIEEILRNAECPLLIIGPRVTETELAKRNLERIVYVTDYTRDSLEGLPCVLALAQDYKAQVKFVHVAGEMAMMPFHFGNSRIVAFRKSLESTVASSGAVLQDSEFAVQEGDRPRGIVRIATNLRASLITLNLRRMPDGTPLYPLWSVAVEVLRLALCPVLMVRGPSSEYFRRQGP